MEKFLSLLLSVYLIIIFPACSQEKAFQAENLEKIWESPKVLKTPESVLYDTKRDVIYVSCINGKPSEKDRNGYIAKLSPDGKIAGHQWVTGMDAPKGMGIYKNNLYVSDISRVICIDIKKGTITRRFEAKDAQFLNDITIDNSGNVYISDMPANKIYRIHKDKIEIWLDSDKLDKPNGLYAEKDKLLVGTSSSVVSVDLKSKEISTYITNTGSIDGIVPDGNGNYLISDWSGNVHLVCAGKKKIKLLNTTPDKINAADIDFVPEKNMLLVPTFMDNRVMAYIIK